jgi:hypothetical protein
MPDKNSNELLAQFAALQRENEALKAAAAKAATSTIRVKVSDKGGLSVYGLGRWPVTLYASQWRRLIQTIPTIEQALVDNVHKLAEKPTAEQAQA